jgi:hypothetical protein
MVYRFQKHKVHLLEIRGSVSSRSIFLIEKYKRFSKFIKEKYSEHIFQFLSFKAFLLSKIGCICATAVVQTLL